MSLLDLFTGGSSDSNTDSNDGKGSSMLGMLIKALTGDKDNTGDDKNPLAKLFTALISFLQELFNPTDKSAPPAPGFEDTRDPSAGQQPAETPAQRAARNRREQQESDARYHEPIWKKYNPITIAKVPHELDALRQQAEAANGGRHVDAISPVADMGRITSGFGDREAPMKGASTEHKGLDIAPATAGDPNVSIVAPMPGVVVFAGWKSGYGNTLDVMDIYGTTHRFGHLAEIDKKVGEQVNQGDKVAVMGMTGNATGIHLHYEQRDEHQVAFNPIINGQTYVAGNVVRENQTVLASNSSPGRSHGAASLDDRIAGLSLPPNITPGGDHSTPTSGLNASLANASRLLGG